jgi:molybdopterin biosynthesis enzyme
LGYLEIGLGGEGYEGYFFEDVFSEHEIAEYAHAHVDGEGYAVTYSQSTREFLRVSHIPIHLRVNAVTAPGCHEESDTERE